MELTVGDVVTTRLEVLGCKPGTRGVVYETYPDFDIPGKMGASIIFENGDYDGFSIKDQELFLKEEHIQYIPFYIRDYKFTNVMKLSRDFRNDFWGEIFR